MVLVVTVQCLYLIFMDVLESVCSQEVVISNRKLSWENANSSCTLVKSTHDFTSIYTVLQQGQRAWTGKRILYSHWMSLEDCAQYNLDQNLFTIIKLKGVSLTIECYKGCKSLNPQSFVLRFGLMETDNEYLCLCKNSSQPNPTFGSRGNSCTPINCKRGTDEDLCGDEGLLVYRSYAIDITNFRGSGDCGSFIRTDNETLNGMAVSCQEKLGHLQEIASDPISCLSDQCFCVAVHREKKTLQEDLVDCNTELPSLCVSESVTTTPSPVTAALSTNDEPSTSVFSTNVTRSKDSKTTKTEISRTYANGFLVPTVVSVAVFTVLAAVTVVILLIKRKRGRRGKEKNPSIKEAQTSYVNTALNIPEEKQESSYETTLICPAEQNYEPLQNLTLQIQPSEQQRSIDHKYLTGSENSAYEETHVDSYEHVYSKLK